MRDRERTGPGSAACLLKPDVVVYRNRDVLLTSQISLRSLDGGVSQQELDLFEIPTCFATELGAGAAEVVSAKALDSDLFR